MSGSRSPGPGITVAAGDRPPPPRCALGRVIDEPRDVDAVKARLFARERVLVAAIDDERLSRQERDQLVAIGGKLYRGSR